VNILVIAPHPDDESIGCGGTLCLHADKGDRVSAVFLTSGECGLKELPREQAWAIREKEARKAGEILRIVEFFFLRCSDWMLNQEIEKGGELLRPILQRTRPELIYLPHPQDGHPDHQATLPILRFALQRSGAKPAALRSYEVWTPLAQYDHVQDISSVLDRKLKAVRAHKSQSRDLDYARAIAGLNQYRGELAARARYAEVFTETRLEPV
jgi:LmbE family N-acetylglucosaminyl deacetylase